jgi:hypothetical protein
MGINKFEGETLPFTKHGWTRQIRSGTFRNGGTYKHVEKVKVLEPQKGRDRAGVCYPRPTRWGWVVHSYL